MYLSHQRLTFDTHTHTHTQTSTHTPSSTFPSSLVSILGGKNWCDCCSILLYIVLILLGGVAPHNLSLIPSNIYTPKTVLSTFLPSSVLLLGAQYFIYITPIYIYSIVQPSLVQILLSFFRLILSPFQSS